jgi:hypothetical protein
MLTLFVLLKNLWLFHHAFHSLQANQIEKKWILKQSSYQEQMGRTSGAVYLLLDIFTVGGSRRPNPNLIRKCTTRVLSEVPLSPVTSDIRYNGAKLMKAMQQHLEHVVTVQCKHNWVFRCDCVVSVVTRLRAGRQRNRASIPGRGSGLSLLQSFQIDTGAHPASYWMGTGGSFPGSNAAGSWSWPLTQFRAEVKNEWSYNPTRTNLPFKFSRVAEISQKYRRHLKTPGARMVMWSTFRNGDPQILGATVENLVARALCTPAFSVVIIFWGWWAMVTLLQIWRKGWVKDFLHKKAHAFPPLCTDLSVSIFRTPASNRLQVSGGVI